LEIKFYIDSETRKPHIHKHNILESEIIEFFHDITYFSKERFDNSFEALGKIKSDRFLQIVYRKESNDSIFVITAYDIEDVELIHALEDFYENH
jgi:uncharacterized DUF497 family protein